MVLLLKKVNLKGEYGEEAVNRRADVLDAVLLPRPYLGRDVIIDGADGLRLNEFRNLEVEARIVHQNDAVRAPRGNLLLAARHAFENGAQVEQNGDKTHVGEVLVVAQKRAANPLHFIAAIVAEFSLRVGILYSLHKVGGMEVAAGFAYDEEIFHGENVGRKGRVRKSVGAGENYVRDNLNYVPNVSIYLGLCFCQLRCRFFTRKKGASVIRNASHQV